MEEKIQKSTEYCEQRHSQQYQGEDHENTAVRSNHLDLSSETQLTNRDNKKELFNYNSYRQTIIENSSVSFGPGNNAKGQDSPCKNDFKYLG